MNEEAVQVTALKADSPEMPVTSGIGVSITDFPRRADITCGPAAHHDIEALSHAEEVTDGEDSRRVLMARQPSGSNVSPGQAAPGPRSRLHSLLARTDAGTAVGQFQNNGYLALERLASHLPQFKDSVAALQTAVRNPALPQKEREELGRLTRELMQKIDRVATERPAPPVLATKLFFSMASIGLCMLPLLTAEKNKDYQYLSMLIAGYAKTMLMLVGLALSKTADAGSYATHLKERHIPYLVPTLPYAVSAFHAQAKQFEEHHPLAFSGAAAAFTGTIFLLTSAPHLVTGPVSGMYDKVRNYFDANPDGGADTSAALAEQLSNEIGELSAAFRGQHEAMTRRRNEFEQGGNELSDVLSTQVSDIDHAAMQLDDALTKLLAGEAPGTGSGTVARTNDDVTKKMAFTLLAAVLCAGSAATYYDEMVGLVDLGADAALTIGELTKTALNPAETAQRAAEKFASYSGLAPFLLPYGIINKIPATHFTDSVAGLVVGVTLLTCANVSLPRPTAEFLSQAILKVMDRIKASREGLPQDGAEHGMEMTGNSSVRITELTDEDDGMAAHGSDTVIDVRPGQPEQSGPPHEADRIDIVIAGAETPASSTTPVDKR